MVVDEVVRYYRSGACFAMAEALSRLTGYPVRHIQFGSFAHAFVVSPDNEVLDIHGRRHWPEFLDFLVENKAFSQEEVEAGKIAHKSMEGVVDSILWRDWGYKPPSETAIKKAMAIARSHPNLRGEFSGLFGKSKPNQSIAP